MLPLLSSRRLEEERSGFVLALYPQSPKSDPRRVHRRPAPKITDREFDVCLHGRQGALAHKSYATAEGPDRSQRCFARWHAVLSAPPKKANHPAATVTVAPMFTDVYLAHFTTTEPRAQRDH